MITTHWPFTFLTTTFCPMLNAVALVTEAVTCSPVARATVTPESWPFWSAIPVTVPVCVAEVDGAVVEGAVAEGAVVD